MKFIIIFFLCSVKLCYAQDKFVGNWTAKQGTLQIEIFKQKEEYFAKIIASNNPEIVNKLVLMQMIKKSAEKLYGGTYFDEKLNTENEAKIKLLANNKMRLKILAGLKSKVILWHKS